MRYIINTQDSEGIIGIQLDKWKKEGKLELLEKGEPLVELKAHLEKISNALILLKKAGYNRDVMIAYIKDQCQPIGKGTIRSVLDGQDEFFKAIGLLK